jgi:hypothetical protein
MLKKVFASIIFVMGISSIINAADLGIWAPTGATFTISSTDSGDCLKVDSGSTRQVKLFSKNTTPARFALTFKMIEDFFNNDDNATLHIIYTYSNGYNRIDSVYRVGK